MCADQTWIDGLLATSSPHNILEHVPKVVSCHLDEVELSPGYPLRVWRALERRGDRMGVANYSHILGGGFDWRMCHRLGDDFFVLINDIHRRHRVLEHIGVNLRHFRVLRQRRGLRLKAIRWREEFAARRDGDFLEPRLGSAKRSMAQVFEFTEQKGVSMRHHGRLVLDHQRGCWFWKRTRLDRHTHRLAWFTGRYCQTIAYLYR